MFGVASLSPRPERGNRRFRGPQRRGGSNRAPDLDDALLRVLDADGGGTICRDRGADFPISSVPRRDADGVRRHSSFLAVWYHVPCWLRSNTHTHAIRDLRIPVELHYALPYVTAYPVAPHPPTGFVPAPTQPPTYGGKTKHLSPRLVSLPPSPSTPTPFAPACGMRRARSPSSSVPFPSARNE